MTITHDALDLIMQEQTSLYRDHLRRTVIPKPHPFLTGSFPTSLAPVPLDMSKFFPNEVNKLNKKVVGIPLQCFLFLDMLTDMGVQASWSSLGFATENGVLSFQICWVFFVRKCLTYIVFF